LRAILLDTQVLLWWLGDDPRLGSESRLLVATSGAVVSTVSFWEIAIKSGLGKLSVEAGEVMLAADAAGMKRLRIEDGHLVAVQSLARRANHGDPFDRLLIAQAQVERMSILTADAMFAAYDIEILPARA
jgi:PIN domain nuclease of toxin-antitoxin system